MELTKQDIHTKYEALLDIERTIRASGMISANVVYRKFDKKFSRNDFDRIIHVLELSGEVRTVDGMLVRVRRAN